MKLQADRLSDNYVITGHGPGWVGVNGQRYQRSLLLLPDRIDVSWGPAAPAELSAAHFEALAALAGHIVILGTGLRQCFPELALRRVLIDAGIGLEIMDTGAACRTYSILVAEGRAVAAALIVE